jgi:hypothetical protein
MVFAFCLPLTATLIPLPNLAKQVEAADAIVVAKLVRGTTVASGDRITSDLVLHIDRVLKGNPIPGAEVAASLEGRNLFFSGVHSSSQTPQVYGIWFLSSTSVLPRLQSIGDPAMAPVILPEQTPAGDRGNTPEVSVANEIVSALRWFANGKVQGEFSTLADNFRTLSPATTLPIYRQLAAEQSLDLRAVGIQGLIAANEPEGPIQLASDWTKLTAANPQIGMPLMSYTNEDPSGVRALGSPALREHAAYALRAIHTKEALPALAVLLDSKNAIIQSQALSGFCLFVRNAPIVTPQSVPSMSWLQTRQPAPFLNPETERYCHPGGTVYPSGDLAAYVNFWKSWWYAHKVEIEQP